MPVAEPGSWFETTIQSIAAQDYPDLAVTLVHDPDDAALLERHADEVDHLELVEAPLGAGFGHKVSAGIDASDEALLLICHDDVAFAEGAIAALVREWLRRRDRSAAQGLLASRRTSRGQCNAEKVAHGRRQPIAEYTHNAEEDPYYAARACWLFRRPL